VKAAERLGAVVLGCALLFANVALAQSEPSPLAHLTVLGHWMAPGAYDVAVSDTSAETGIGGGMSLAVGFWPIEHLNLGMQAFRMVRAERGGEVGASSLTHLGAHAGWSWLFGDRVLLGVTALLGWNLLLFQDADEPTHGLGVGLLGDLNVFLIRGFAITGQLGLIGQPLGGNDATAIHIPPSFVAGLGFATLAWR
jgi:hypothetical protein